MVHRGHKKSGIRQCFTRGSARTLWSCTLQTLKGAYEQFRLALAGVARVAPPEPCCPKPVPSAAGEPARSPEKPQSRLWRSRLEQTSLLWPGDEFLPERRCRPGRERQGQQRRRGCWGRSPRALRCPRGARGSGTGFGLGIVCQAFCVPVSECNSPLPWVLRAPAASCPAPEISLWEFAAGTISVRGGARAV